MSDEDISRMQKAIEEKNAGDLQATLERVGCEWLEAHDRKTELLFSATVFMSVDCLKVLVSPPYCLSPDKTYDDLTTALKMGANLNIPLTTFYLTKYSNEEFGATFTDDFQNNVTTFLFFPQLYRNHKANQLEAMFAEFQTHEYMKHLDGTLLVLFHELLLSEEEGVYENQPPSMHPLKTILQKPYPSMGNLIGHQCNCENYPECLMKTYFEFNDETKVFLASYYAWKYHRFGCTQDDGQILQGCLKLQDLCRINIRRYITRKYCKCTSNLPNYHRAVDTLKLPQRLCDYLLYKEIYENTELVTFV